MNPKVLMIDDELALIKNLADLLTKRGFETSIAANGAEGIKLLEAGEFDVVLLDLRMPGQSGMDVLKRIKIMKNAAPEVIIFTGFGTIDSSIESLQNGAFDYLTKPIRIGELVERLTKAFQRMMIKKGVEMNRYSDGYGSPDCMENSR